MCPLASAIVFHASTKELAHVPAAPLTGFPVCVTASPVPLDVVMVIPDALAFAAIGAPGVQAVAFRRVTVRSGICYSRKEHHGDYKEEQLFHRFGFPSISIIVSCGRE
jgi:hypothetical protein